MNREKIVIIDFGSQFTQLIARKVRELGVYSEIINFSKTKNISKYVAEGVEGIVQFKGPVNKIIYQLVGGLKSSMGYMGSKTIKDLQKKCVFVKITKAGFYESMVHNVDQIKK